MDERVGEEMLEWEGKEGGRKGAKSEERKEGYLESISLTLLDHIQMINQLLVYPEMNVQMTT